jgi:hypothetical protein
MRPEYEVIRDRLDQESWRVEGIDYANDGIVYIAVFTGPRAIERAEEYAAFKNQVGSEGDLNVDLVYAGLRT